MGQTLRALSRGLLLRFGGLCISSPAGERRVEGLVEASRLEEVHTDQEALNRRILEQQCLKRRGTPEDVGNLVTFLASDAASFITGQTVMIDGGWAMH